MVLGHCLCKGLCVWLDFAEADRTLGALVRRPFVSSKGGTVRRRAQHLFVPARTLLMRRLRKGGEMRGRCGWGGLRRRNSAAAAAAMPKM